MKLKKIAKFVLGKRLLSAVNILRIGRLDRRGYPSYAQEGEDRVLSSLLIKLHGAKQINDGFYVDVGAHHPHRYSNTYLFYKRGWHGINIDAMPGSMSAFNTQRPRDINLERGVGGTAETLKFYVLNEPALNSFDEKLAKSRCNDSWHINRIVDVPIVTLTEVLKEHLPRGQKIDFLTVDVEGFDLNVLHSNDWQKYRPLIVLAETFGLSFESSASDPVTTYMRSLGYIVYSRTVNTTFFVDSTAAQYASIQLSKNPEEFPQ